MTPELFQDLLGGILYLFLILLLASIGLGVVKLWYRIR